MDPELHQLLNQQINNEMASSYSYLAMSAWLEETPYAGFAQWMYVQSLEETEHAMKFYRYLSDRDVKVELKALGQPKCDYSNVLEVFNASYEQEQKVTAQIHEIYSKAQEVRDHETTTFLNWFLDEQVEEEKQIRDMIDRLELVGEYPVGMLQLDQEAAQRKPLAGPVDAGGAA
jgi:ferritin